MQRITKSNLYVYGTYRRLLGSRAEKTEIVKSRKVLGLFFLSLSSADYYSLDSSLVLPFLASVYCSAFQQVLPTCRQYVKHISWISVNELVEHAASKLCVRVEVWDCSSRSDCVLQDQSGGFGRQLVGRQWVGVEWRD
jgi:hypothetical protein